MEGKITYFNKNRGFGFIRTQEHADDLFFHITDVEGCNHAVMIYPEPGERVSFEMGTNKKGNAAKKVKVIS